MLIHSLSTTPRSQIAPLRPVRGGAPLCGGGLWSRHLPSQMMSARRSVLSSSQLTLLVASLCLGGCQREQPPAGAPKAKAPVTKAAPKLPVIADGKGLLFLFFDRRAELRTVERIAQVEPTAAAAVQVVDPSHRLGQDQIVVADLRHRGGKDGSYRRWVETRGAWLARVMPRTSQLKKPLIAVVLPKPKAKAKTPRRKRRPRRRPRRVAARVKTPDAGPAKVAAKKRPRVLLFSTSWCPSCRAAKAYFLERRVPFVELDVEKNMQAQQLFLAIQKRDGLRPGVVPLIVVGKRAFQGFSRDRMEVVLKGMGVLPPGRG